jgi:hypothetical protein
MVQLSKPSPAKVVLVVGLVASINLHAAPLTVTIRNNLPSSQYCANGNTLTIFAKTTQQNIAVGIQANFSGDFSAMPGIGIQVNNWYWAAVKAPVSGQSGDQNPDNSGAQFAIGADCTISEKSKAWFGKGIETYEIATVSAVLDNSGQCVVTVGAINYTDAVTPGCCSPPGIGSDNCSSDQWGQTANKLAWPPLAK